MTTLKQPDETIVVAIIGETLVLLILETTKPKPHYWKFVSERFNSDESVLSALCRALSEEAGFKVEVKRDAQDQVTEITDPRIRTVKELVRSHIVQGYIPHKRHFWGVVTTDDVIRSLSGKHLTGDEFEAIDTMAFGLDEMEKMVDLLPAHRKLLEGMKKTSA